MTLIVGVLFVIAFMHSRAGSRTVPRDVDASTMLAFHRSEVLRQRNLLLAVPFWYLLPFVPGMVVVAASNSLKSGIAPALVGGAIVLGVFVLVWRLNVWGARRLDSEVSKLDVLQSQM